MHKHTTVCFGAVPVYRLEVVVEPSIALTEFVAEGVGALRVAGVAGAEQLVLPDLLSVVGPGEAH